MGAKGGESKSVLRAWFLVLRSRSRSAPSFKKSQHGGVGFRECGRPIEGGWLFEHGAGAAPYGVKRSCTISWFLG